MIEHKTWGDLKQEHAYLIKEHATALTVTEIYVPVQTVSKKCTMIRIHGELQWRFNEDVIESFIEDLGFVEDKLHRQLGKKHILND